MKIKSSFFPIALTLLLFLITSFQKPLFGQQERGKPWPVPDNYKTIKPPVNIKDPAVINVGKGLYNQYCKICHGTNGQGDGPKSAALKTAPGNLKAISITKQNDGEIFYKLNKGREEMPGFEKKLPSLNDQWSLVAFIRSLGNN